MVLKKPAKIVVEAKSRKSRKTTEKQSFSLTKAQVAAIQNLYSKYGFHFFARIDPYGIDGLPAVRKYSKTDKAKYNANWIDQTYQAVRLIDKSIGKEVFKDLQEGQSRSVYPVIDPSTEEGLKAIETHVSKCFSGRYSAWRDGPLDGSSCLKIPDWMLSSEQAAERTNERRTGHESFFVNICTSLLRLTSPGYDIEAVKINGDIHLEIKSDNMMVLDTFGELNSSWVLEILMKAFGKAYALVLKRNNVKSIYFRNAAVCASDTKSFKNVKGISRYRKLLPDIKLLVIVSSVDVPLKDIIKNEKEYSFDDIVEEWIVDRSRDLVKKITAEEENLRILQSKLLKKTAELVKVKGALKSFKNYGKEIFKNFSLDGIDGITKYSFQDGCIIVHTEDMWYEPKNYTDITDGRRRYLGRYVIFADIINNDVWFHNVNMHKRSSAHTHTSSANSIDLSSQGSICLGGFYEMMESAILETDYPLLITIMIEMLRNTDEDGEYRLSDRLTEDEYAKAKPKSFSTSTPIRTIGRAQPFTSFTYLMTQSPEEVSGLNNLHLLLEDERKDKVDDEDDEDEDEDEEEVAEVDEDDDY